MDLTPDGKDSGSLCPDSCHPITRKGPFRYDRTSQVAFKLGPSDLNEYGTLGPQATAHHFVRNLGRCCMDKRFSQVYSVMLSLLQLFDNTLTIDSCATVPLVLHEDDVRFTGTGRIAAN